MQGKAQLRSKRTGWGIVLDIINPLNLAKKHKLAFAAIVIAAVVVVWFAVREVAGPKIEVQLPKRGPLVLSVVTTGRVRPLRVRIAPVVSGTIREVLVSEGANVVAGQVLLRIDDKEAKATLAKAEAMLAQAHANRRRLNTLSSAEAGEAVSQAEARLAEATRDYERNRELAPGGAVSKAALQQSKTNLDLARSVLRSATNQRRDVMAGGATVISAEAALAQAEANVSLAQVHLSYTLLKAPVAGVIIERKAEGGDSVTANTQVLSLAATSRTELVVEPDERNLALLAVGQTALASAEAYPDKRFSAQVNFIAPVVDSRRGTIEVRLIVPDSPEYLKPDMTVSVDIEVERKQDALLVPVGAVRELASSAPNVLIVDNRRVLRRPIEVGIKDAVNVEVVSGLEGTESVVLHPDTVEVGARVRARASQP